MTRMCNVTGVSIYMQSFTIQLETPSGNIVPPNGSGTVTQSLKVSNPQKVSSVGCIHWIIYQHNTILHKCGVIVRM